MFTNDLSTILALLFEIVLVLRVVFVVLNFSHVRHEANQSAHYLAKYTLKNLGCIWIEETPPCISVVLAFDLLPDFR